jgi:hypothetical protein
MHGNTGARDTLPRRKTPKISAPTLIADGTEDELDPVANDHTLAHLIRGSRLTPTGSRPLWLALATSWSPALPFGLAMRPGQAPPPVAELREQVVQAIRRLTSV